MVKFHFTNSKLREKHFSTKQLMGKYQVLNSYGQGQSPLVPMSDTLLVPA